MWFLWKIFYLSWFSKRAHKKYLQRSQIFTLTSASNLRKHIKIINKVHENYKCHSCGKSFIVGNSPAVLVWPAWKWAEWEKQLGNTKLKSYMHFKAKLKHVLWLGALKFSLINYKEKFIYKTSSIEIVTISMGKYNHVVASTSQYIYLGYVWPGGFSMVEKPPLYTHHI